MLWKPYRNTGALWYTKVWLNLVNLVGLNGKTPGIRGVIALLKSPGPTTPHWEWYRTVYLLVADEIVLYVRRGFLPLSSARTEDMGTLKKMAK